MASKRITGRQLRHGAPEERLSPGQSFVIEKRGGKRFELTRIDTGRLTSTSRWIKFSGKSRQTGKRLKTNLASVLLEERE